MSVIDVSGRNGEFIGKMTNTSDLKFAFVVIYTENRSVARIMIVKKLL